MGFRALQGVHGRLARQERPDQHCGGVGQRLPRDLQLGRHRRRQRGGALWRCVHVHRQLAQCGRCARRGPGHRAHLAQARAGATRWRDGSRAGWALPHLRAAGLQGAPRRGRRAGGQGPSHRQGRRRQGPRRLTRRLPGVAAAAARQGAAQTDGGSCGGQGKARQRRRDHARDGGDRGVEHRGARRESLAALHVLPAPVLARHARVARALHRGLCRRRPCARARAAA